ncbi:MAG TPA: glycosyltransferase 87 family protein [Ktedonobacteraceae bacterium]|jgi:Gpi18-like mannosyltransferase
MVLKEERFILLRRVLIRCGLVLLFGLAIELRVSLYHIETSDYSVFLSQWYDFIQTHGGLAALKDNFSNYNTPYLTLLALTTYLPIPKLIAIKTLSVIFDGVLGIFVYLILQLRYKRALAALAGVLVLLFAPTIFINSAAWGQCDALYTAFCLGSLYFLLKQRPGWACVFFALALAFKLQAVFFAPILFILLLKKRLPLPYLALIPLVFALMLTPALIAGRSAPSLLMIYAEQISGGGVGGASVSNNHDAGFFHNGTGVSPSLNNGNTNRSGSFNGNGPQSFNGGQPGGTGSSSSLTLNAPSFYQWLPTDAPANVWKWVGIALAALFILTMSILLLLNKRQLTSALLIKIALLFALAMPFFLPEMHERYFYLADVLSILYAFSFPRMFYVAIVTQLCSLLSYAPYFLQRQIVPLSYVAGAILLLIVIVLIDLARSLSARSKPALPEKEDRVEASGGTSVALRPGCQRRDG